ncbi:hypothetical protein KVG29_04345 [Caldicoprobacter algeriensis]|uniref:hypothetical protein n=1 Tax=Caldicoprobacter algeriensis TaxID=699281 RepID=UPI002079BC5F|nr:hypothetical protein [Caldicoprobacter algeriensis]MCM8900457.1 hypothetical protein [Caldicoprobacter algeriensis]
MNKNINYDRLIEQVGKCCLTEDFCGTCQKEACLIGYCKHVLLKAFKQHNEFIDGGMDNIPSFDTKLYDEEDLINAIAFILNECKNCQLYHDDECVINIIRSCMEIALLGDYLEYKGSTFLYFADLNNENKEIAQRIFEAFSNIKNNK